MSTDELLTRAQTRVGAVLSQKYRLDAVLGTGGMASVFSATHLRNANRVAVKILHRELAVDAGIRARFLREGYASNTVEHPAAVRILDDDAAEDGSVFLVMELLEGEPLDVRWERLGCRLPVDEVVSITWQLLDVLAVAHEKGIVHRDLKPQNLFVDREGRLRLLDFGVARLHELAPTTTRSGAVVGTPAFMAPEQAIGRRREVDALSDLWSVGATAFALAAGRCVHEADTPEGILVLAATVAAPPLASVAPGVPGALAAVIDRALAFSKADRWPSARAMQHALQEAAESAGCIEAPGAPAASASASASARPRAVSTPFTVVAVPPVAPVAARGDGRKPRWRRTLAVVTIGAASVVALAAAAASRGGGGRGAVGVAATSPAEPSHAVAIERAPAPSVDPALAATEVLSPLPPPSSLSPVAPPRVSAPSPSGPRPPSPPARVKAALPGLLPGQPSASSKRDPLAP